MKPEKQRQKLLSRLSATQEALAEVYRECFGRGVLSHETERKVVDALMPFIAEAAIFENSFEK